MAIRGIFNPGNLPAEAVLSAAVMLPRRAVPACAGLRVVGAVDLVAGAAVFAVVEVAVEEEGVDEIR